MIVNSILDTCLLALYEAGLQSLHEIEDNAMAVYNTRVNEMNNKRFGKRLMV